MFKLTTFFVLLCASQTHSQPSTPIKRQLLTDKKYYKSFGYELVKSGSYKTAQGATRTVQGFFISEEISIKEFRVFTDYVFAHPDDQLTYVDRTENNSTLVTVRYSDIQNRLIDSTVFERFYKNDTTELLKYKNYFLDKKFENSPVVGVSKEIATIYCVWKTANVNALLANKNIGQINDFRLPEPEEMEYLHSISTRGLHRHIGIQKSTRRITTITARVTSNRFKNSTSEDNDAVVNVINEPSSIQLVSTYLGK